MTTKKLKTKIKETIKKLENYLEEAENDIQKNGETEYDKELIERTKIFYEDMLNEIEVYEGKSK